MTIAFLTPEYPHEKTGPSAGLGTSIKNLTNGLMAEGVEVIIVVTGQQRSQVFSDEGIPVHMLKQKKYPTLGFFLYRKFVQRYLNKLIESHKIDLVEAPDWTGLTAFMNLKAPVIIRFHGSDAYFCQLEGRKQKRKNFWFEKKALTGADHLLSVSRFTADKTKEIFKLQKNIIVIPNGVDVDQFGPGTGKTEDNTLLYFGSLIRKKGVIELANIFNMVIEKQPDAILTLVGKDVIDLKEKRSTLAIIEESLSKEAKSRFKYVPEVPYDKINGYIASHAVIVFPSFAEAFPMTWLEAMAMEKALVTSNIGWADEIMINGETGFMEDPLNHSEFADKILKLLNDQKLQLEMGKKSRQRIGVDFSAEETANKNIEFYRNVIERET